MQRQAFSSALRRHGQPKPFSGAPKPANSGGRVTGGEGGHRGAVRGGLWLWVGFAALPREYEAPPTYSPLRVSPEAGACI